MSQRIAEPFLYSCYLTKAGEKTDYVGGAPDVVSAAVIASAAYERWQVAVGIFDDAETLIAYIGKHSDLPQPS